MQQLRDDVAYVGDQLISNLIPRRALDKHCMKGVGHRTAWDQLVRLTKHWQSVENFIVKNPGGPWGLSLTDSGWRQLSYRP